VSLGVLTIVKRAVFWIGAGQNRFVSAFVRSQVVVEFSAFFTYAKTWFGIVLSAWLWVGFGVSRLEASRTCRGPRLLEAVEALVSVAWSGRVLRISKRKIYKLGISKYL
jgi:hypothetical protein